MNARLHLCLACLLFLTACVSPRPEVTLGITHGDFNGDHRKDTLALVWTGGRYFVDEELWCGNGPKYTGRFVLRVKLAGQPAVDTELAGLTDAFKFIPASDKPWKICVADYNHDGQTDFNLGAYGGCSWQDFMLFTIQPDGHVAVLKISTDRIPYRLKNSEADHSTDEFELTSTGFKNSSYDHMTEEFYEVTYVWDGAANLFQYNERRWKAAP